MGDLVEVAPDTATCDLRVDVGDQVGRADEIDEEHGCQLPLHHAPIVVSAAFRARIAPVLDPKVFKAYDVRGIYPDELDEAGAEAIGRAYVEQFEPRRMAVGRDVRLSSAAMQEAFMRGAAAAGADVFDLGLVGTEMVYFAVGSLGLEGGAMVTASHNPKQYTGMKLVRRGALPVGGESGLLDVRDRASRRRRSAQRVRREDRTARHLARLCRPRAVVRRRLRDQASEGRDRRGERDGRRDAPAGARAASDRDRPLLLRAGRHFPNHEPNPLLPENREFIVRKTLDEGADLGVAFDGDADRCFFVDDTGEFVPGDFVTALFAQSCSRRSPARRSSTTCARAGPCPTRSSATAASR